MNNAPLRIVIVEDEAAHAEAIRRAFEEAGMAGGISVAGTLEEYRESIANRPPDVAIMDLNLPDGRAVEDLRLPPEDNPFPILIMTSYGNEQVAVEALKSGALDYVVKSQEAFAAMPRTVTRVLREWNLLQERKRAEEEVHRAKEELEIRVRERTRELERAYADLRLESERRVTAVEDLRKKEQLLLQQNRLAAMGEMIGNIAHQWRQPLNVLGLMIQDLLLSHGNGSLGQDYLQTTVSKAMQVINHMSQTIDDFRNFFRQDRGEIRFEINKIVATTVSLIEASFKAQQVGIEVREQDTLWVEGSPGEFSQVILNLLLNARDVLVERDTPERRVAVTIMREEESSVVTISDNGGGVPEGIVHRIFEPYFTTKGPKGTGIGLFMSKVIIENNMHGRLSFRNSEQGAEFRIEF